MIDFLNYLINGSLVGLLYALIAMGFIVIYRASKVFNFAQGELVVFGGFIVWWMVIQTGLPLFVALPLAMAVSAIFGLIIERIFFSRLVGESSFAMVMVTIGLLILIRGLILLIFGPQVRPFPIIFALKPVIIGDITATALKVALSGDEHAAQELEARAKHIEASIEAAVEDRARQLEKRAEALCDSVDDLKRIERALSVRLADGSSLDLVR